MEDAGMDPLWARALLREAGARDEVARVALGHARRRLVAGGMSGADLECLVQETLVRVLIALDRGDLVRKFGAFVKCKARGVLKDWRAKASHALNTSMEPASEPVGREDAPETGLIDEERCEALLECMGRLSEKLASVARLRYQEGMELREVAERLGLTPETAAVRCFRAVAGIRECLSGKGIEE